MMIRDMEDANGYDDSEILAPEPKPFYVADIQRELHPTEVADIFRRQMESAKAAAYAEGIKEGMVVGRAQAIPDTEAYSLGLKEGSDKGFIEIGLICKQHEAELADVLKANDICSAKLLHAQEHNKQLVRAYETLLETYKANTQKLQAQVDKDMVEDKCLEAYDKGFEAGEEYAKKQKGLVSP